jgi:hypothetical protein
MAESYILTVDTPEPGILRLELVDAAGTSMVSETRYGVPGPESQGQHVDNVLLTAFDKIVQESRLHRSALITVKLGPGIDKNSALCRIVQSFASALGAGTGAR